MRPIEYQEGRAHGLKAIEVKNGPLRFVSMADRALDICQFEYRGENLTFLSKPGLNGRNQFDTNGLEAQRSIMGGLFFTCGFENICAPYVTPEGGKYPAGSFPMHGRIRTTPAEHVAPTPLDRRRRLRARGLRRNARGRTVRRESGDAPQDHQRVRPAVDHGRGRGDQRILPRRATHVDVPLQLRLAAARRRRRSRDPQPQGTPRDETTAADTTPWNEIQAPEANRPESVYLHELAADENGRSFAAVVNHKLGLGVVIDFDANLFPYFMEWKSMGAGDYVVGLEPSNSSVHGRGWHEQRGDLHTIAPQASERKSLTFTVIEGEAAIDGLIARRDALLG